MVNVEENIKKSNADQKLDAKRVFFFFFFFFFQAVINDEEIRCRSSVLILFHFFVPSSRVNFSLVGQKSLVSTMSL
jgi:hypothetical protein